MGAVVGLGKSIVRLCPATSIVVPSREILRIEGEFVYRVPPLDVPSPHQEEPDILLGYSAVQLFIARTRALDATFSPDSEDLRAIVAICRHLDDIPLAIELSSGRFTIIGP